MPAEELASDFVEFVPGGAQRFIGRWLLLAAEVATLLATMVAALFTCMAIAFAVATLAGAPLFGQPAKAIANPEQAIIAIGKGIALMFGIGWLAIAVVSLPISFFWVLRGRRRSYRTDGTRLYIERGRKSESVALSDCTWTISKIALDSYGAYLPFSPRIVVSCGSDSYALGFQPYSFRYWRGALELLEAPRAPRFGVTIRQALLGVGFGGCVGFLAGFIIRGAGGSPEWIWVGGVLGMLDGGVVSLMLLEGKSDWHKWRANGLFPLLLASMFAAVGIKIGMIPGAVANAVIGLLLGEWLRRRFVRSSAADEVERASTSL